jgi:hypothetical protein
LLSRGDVVVLRELWKGRVWKARPWIVVRDRPDELVLWIPKGTPTKIPPGSGIPRDEWTLEDGSFFSDALRVVTPGIARARDADSQRPPRRAHDLQAQSARAGTAHSILHFFEDGRFRRWYVNVERPLRRSRIGFDYLDLELDVLVEQDGSWRLEDEDELEEAVRLGVISADEATDVRAEARRVIDRWPFPTGWESFVPDAGWELPQLPPDWDTVG